MRRILLSVLASALFPCLAGASPADYVAAASRNLQRFVLDDGMVCLVKEDHSAPVVSVQIWVGTGSIHEGEYLGAGLSHYMEHMIFKGTEQRGPTDITTEINEAGGDINAYTSLDRTVFHSVLPAKNWKVGVDVLSDAVMHASFPEEEWAREKDVVIREVAMGKDDPSRVLWKLLSRTAYRVHPYRFPVIGYEDIFEKVTRDDLVTFFRRHYVPDNMITVVVGDIDAGTVRTYLEETFADFARRARAPVVLPQEPPQLAPRFQRETGPYKLSRLRMAYHTVPLNHPDTPALDVLSYIVGHGRSSRLVKKIKEEAQLAFELDAWSYTPREAGYFGVAATFAPEKEKEVVAGIDAEIRSWNTTAFTEAEIEKARRQLLVQELAALETMKGQADSFASGEFFAGDPRYGVWYLDALENVTTDDLHRVVTTYLRPENQTLVVLSPEVTSPAKEPASVAEPMVGKVERRELGNGIPLLVREDHRVPFVHFCFALRGGLLSESEGTSGVTQLMADLLTRGTASRSAENIAREVESLGATLAPFSGWNSFGIQARCLSGDLEAFVPLLTDCLLSSTFPEGEVEKQRQVQLAAIEQEREQPFFLAVEALKATLFPNHPYRLNPAGSTASVAALSQEVLQKHKENLVGADNLAIAVFGDVTPEHALALAEGAFGSLGPRKGAAPVPPPEATPDLPARTTRREPKEQAIVLLGFPGVDVADPRLDALTIIREAMSGLSSELGIEVREKRGLVYYVGALQRAGMEPGLFTFYAGTREEATAEVENLIQQQIQRLAAEGLSEEESMRAREQIIAAYEMGLQDNGGLAQTCALDELYGLGYDHVFSTEERIRAVTAEAIRNAAAELMKPENEAVSILLPEPTPEEEKDP